MDEAGDVDDAGVYARELPAFDRAVELGLAGGRVISVSFPESVPWDAGTDHELLDRVVAYLDGEGDLEGVTVALTVPTDRRRVLEALGGVPRGETVTVERLARMAAGTDPEGDLGTVRAALRNNPVPLFVPDHRVRDAEGATPAAIAEHLRSLEA